jgi:SAM-dependent methyltransferase
VTETLDRVVCPRDRLALSVDGAEVTCANGHSYPFLDGVPVLLLDDAAPTHPRYWATIQEPFPVEDTPAPAPGVIDPYVRLALQASCGRLFNPDRLRSYPIPELPFRGPGRFLEIGSNWGRWTIAAAQAGFDATGIDPSLGAVRAARRVARQVDVKADFAVADGRFLPFPDATFDVVFSYSVLQHLSPRSVARALQETGRVLKPGGAALHQFTNDRGLWNLVKQARRGFRRPQEFEVRYWRRRDLQRVFERTVGSPTFEVDAYFTLNPHAPDVSQLPPISRAVTYVSRGLTHAVGGNSVLSGFADSVWVKAVRPL